MRVRVRTVVFFCAVIGSSLALVPTFMACSSSCDSCDKDGSANDAATISDVATTSDGAIACACPAVDAAFFTSSGTTCCAGSSCVAGHQDGFGHAFYDCYGVGQWATGLAMDACQAHFDASASCVATTCALSQVVEGTASTCVTWSYEGNDTSTIGHVHSSANTTCVCPDAGDPSWY